MRLLALYNTMDRPETELLLRLADRGMEIEVVCNTSTGFSNLLENSEIPFRHAVCGNKLDSQARRLVASLVEERKFDAIHAFTGRWLAAVNLVLGFQKQRPKILAYRGALGGVGRFDPFAWLTFRHPAVSHINCVSDAVKTHLAAAGIKEQKLVRIYKGHETAWYEPQNIVTRAELGIPEDALVVTCVANVRPNKGVDLLIDAAVQLADPRIHFLIVGDLRNSELERQAQQSTQNSQIHFTGIRSDVPALLRCTDLFVMPTRYSEGLPKAVIEAMCQSIPVIVTHVGGMIELVRNDVDGLVIEPCQAAAIASAIRRLADNAETRKKMGAAGRLRIEQSFNIAATVVETERFYSL